MLLYVSSRMVSLGLTLFSLGFFEHSQPGGGDSAPPPTVTFLLLMQIKNP